MTRQSQSPRYYRALHCARFGQDRLRAACGGGRCAARLDQNCAQRTGKRAAGTKKLAFSQTKSAKRLAKQSAIKEQRNGVQPNQETAPGNGPGPGGRSRVRWFPANRPTPNSEDPMMFLLERGRPHKALRPHVRLRQGCDPSHNMQDFEGCAGLAGAEPHA